MRFLATSDLHYPWEMTRMTFLRENGYSEQLYTSDFAICREDADFDAFLGVGDYFWDVTKLGGSHMQRLISFPVILGNVFRFIRTLPVSKPKLFVAGNHDWWIEQKVVQHVEDIDGTASGVIISIEILRRHHPEAPAELWKDMTKACARELGVKAQRDGSLFLDIPNVFFLNGSAAVVGDVAVIGASDPTHITAAFESLKSMARLPRTVIAAVHAPGNVTAGLRAVDSLSPAPVGLMVYGHYHSSTPSRVGRVRSVMLEHNGFKFVPLDV
ncbi:hypothetical protein J8273_2692 [Carpediemonas membranifera]|uniref:Calcineurin-like phosphoesterase domain-containing protein n=1 Tax=Carpediemonas membranifera TaxID=201153 RepID=A0A8J6AYY1_9EUKA|nr:hypothetical protein J8273_2692 [Carpediemonas membranifera]|eukprot:KAG9395780.1 hypothetical protein J8273_2692 [Carpediemonas membranifera]